MTICGLVFASVSTGSAVDTAGNTSAPPQLGDRFPHSATSPAQPSPPRRSPVNTNASYTVGNVSVVDPSVAAGAVGGSEPSIAVDPVHPNHVAITRFTQIVNGSFVSSQPHWGNGNAHVLITTDGGMTWVDEATIPPPPGTPGTFGCPCDQTFDYGRDGRLYGTFLTDAPAQVLVVTGSTTDPTTASAWHWNGNPVQRTSGLSNDADQPWLLVNRDPANTSQDNVYVAWDRGLNVGGEPLEARVSVSNGSDPVNFTVNNKAGTEIPLATNPGLRLATDPRNGTVYALYQQSTFGSGVQPRTVTYRINRSVDAGATWLLNGSPDGQVVDTVPSNQAPAFKFGGVNALLGGVDHAAVDPTNGDVYVAYGQNVGSGTNQIKIRRLTGTSQSALTVGAAHNVSVSTDAALPSVAVTNNGTVGVLYDTHDGTDTVTGFPTFSVHFARSNDHGATFSDTVLESFVSPVGDNGNGRQRILGDYQQLKAVGNNFYGVFSGSRHPFDASANTIDPIFFSGAGIDNDLALVNVPANITTNATSPFGARVSYVPPTAIDESPEVVAVRCTPAPGSVFPIGTTTVTCEASDPDDTNSPVRASFTVTVRGAADQLHDLQLLVDRAPPGNSVRAKLSNASTALAIHDVSATCANLNAFVFEVRAQSGKKIPVATANAWIAAALQIEAVIPCPRT